MKRMIAVLLSLLSLATMCVPSLAAELPTIDTSRTGSIEIYKYDLTKAEKDGLTDSVYLSTGQENEEAAAAWAPYAIPGAEFTMKWLGNVDTYSSGNAADQTVEVVCGVEDQEFINTLGMTSADIVTVKNSIPCFESDTLIHALSDKLTSNNTSTKARLEAIVAKDPNAKVLPLTDSTGKTGAEGLKLGLYLVVETKVPENVTYTVDPFLVTLPTTDRINHNQWLYKVHCYPKNLSGTADLHKEVADHDHGISFSGSAAGFADVATASTNERVDFRILSTVPQMFSPATYLTQYDFVDKLSKGMKYNQQDVKICWYRDKETAQKDYAAATESAPAVCGTHADAVWNYGSEFFSVTYGTVSDGSTMTVKLTKAGLAEVNQPVTKDDQQGKYSGWTMVIYYNATVQTGEAVTYGDKSNPNDVTLTWRRTSDQYFHTLTDTARVYTYGIDLTKVLSGGGTAFSEVQFTLQNSSNVTGPYFLRADKLSDGVYAVTGNSAKKADAAKFTPDSKGHLVLYGMEEDRYTLTEIKTASGYTLLKDPIEIAVNTTYSPGDLCGTLTASATVNGDGVTMKSESGSDHALVPLTVLNTHGFTLPKTGGSGTTLTTVCGILVLAGVAGYVIYSKRKGRA